MEKQKIIDLARKASAGDEDAFEQILEKKSQHILYNAYDFLKNRHDAEDAAQDVVVKMYQYIGKLRDPENFNAWLHKIIHNVCMSKLRGNKYHKNDLDVETVMDTALNEKLIEKDREFLPHAFAEDRSLRDTLLKIIGELPPKRRKAILLYYYEDLTQKEIAEILDVSENTVASNILRAKKDIKKKLETKTGKNIDNELKFEEAGFAAIPVLEEVFRADASARFGSESIANLINFDYKNAANSSPKASKYSSSPGIKVVTLVTVIGIVCGGAFVALGDSIGVSDTEPAVKQQIEQPIAKEPTESTLTKNGEIIFSGGECDCGHENPNIITVNYDDSEVTGEIEYRWEIISSDGRLIEKGTGAHIKLQENAQQGIYTAKFILTDETESTLYIERDFEINK